MKPLVLSLGFGGMTLVSVGSSLHAVGHWWGLMLCLVGGAAIGHVTMKAAE